MDHCLKRRTSIRVEMGFLDGVATSGLGVQGGATMWRGSSYTGWARIRAENYSMYENDFSFRALPGNARRFSTLFQHFNESVNVPKRAINVYKARACEALVNTSPFTGFMPEGQDDDADAIKLAERYFHNSLEEADVRFKFREAITQACLSEAVMKTTLSPVGGEPQQVEDAQIWLTSTGVPLRDQRGGYVFTDEPLEPHPDILGALVLKRDPSVEFRGGEIKSDPRPMLKDTPTTNKLDVHPVGWENFFCSILEPDIHTADCIFHEYDENYDSLLKRTQGVRLNSDARLWLDNLKQSSQRFQQAEGGQPHWNRGERDVEMFGPIRVHICEQWLRYDVYDRGQADEICVVWAVGSGGNQLWPIYYDLMTNASPTGKRPFEVIRVIPVRDRWYGFGFYDLLSNEHRFIDDAWSRIRARSSASGRMDYIRRDAFEGLEYGQPASLSSGRLYVVKSGVPPTTPVSSLIGSIPFPEMDERIWEMLKMCLQTAQLMSGTMTAGDAASSDLPANNTATGQNLLSNESDLMSNDTTQDVIRGITATLKQIIVAVFSTPDAASKLILQESANVLLGVEAAKTLLDWLETNKPQQFAKHVKLLLTKARSKQALEAASAIIAQITGGMPWVQVVQTYGKDVAEALKPLFVDICNAHDMSNADKVLETTMKAVLAQMAAQQAAMVPAQPQ